MKKIVVVGGGTMGLDIAHTFARSGHAVVVREISDELAETSSITMKTTPPAALPPSTAVW